MSIQVQELTIQAHRCRKCKVTFDDNPAGEGKVEVVPTCFCGTTTDPVVCTVKYLKAKEVQHG